METTDLEPFDVLGVAPTATRKEIRAAWKQRLFECHPDHGGSDEATRAVNDAWTILSDPDRLEAARAARRARDAAHRAAQTPPPRSEPPPRPSSRRQSPGPTTPPPRSPRWDIPPRTTSRLRRLMRVFLLVWLAYYGLGWCRSNTAPPLPPPPEVIEQDGPVQAIATGASSCQSGEVTVRVGRAGTTVVVVITDPVITNEQGPARSWAVDIDGREGRLLNTNGTDATATVTVFGRLAGVMVEVGEGPELEVVEAPARVDSRTNRLTFNLTRDHAPTASGSFDWEVHRVVEDETISLCGGVTDRA